MSFDKHVFFIYNAYNWLTTSNVNNVYADEKIELANDGLDLI